MNPNSTELKSDFWRIKILQIASIYFLGSWSIIEAGQFIIERFFISPHWTDVLITFFISSAPGIIYYTYIGNLNIAERKKRAIRILSLNGILTLILLIYFFHAKDLGLIKQNITINDENGNSQIVRTVKPEFTDKILLMYPNDLDTVPQYIATGIFYSLQQYREIHVSNYFQDESEMRLMEKIESVKQFKANYAIEIVKAPKKDIIEVKLFDSKYKLTNSLTFDSKDLFDIIDQSVEMVRNSISTKRITESLPFLPIDEIISKKEDVLIGISEYDYESAIAVDSESSFVNLLFVEFFYNPEGHNDHLMEFINAAMSNRNNLPNNMQLMIKIYYFLLNRQYQKAFISMANYARLNPMDATAIQAFISISVAHDRIIDASSYYELLKSYSEAPSIPAWHLYGVHFTRGEWADAEYYLKEGIKTDNFRYHLFQAEIFFAKEKYQDAILELEKARLMEPDYTGIDSMITALNYYQNTSARNLENALSAFEGEYLNGRFFRFEEKVVQGNKLVSIYNGQPQTCFFLKNDSTLIDGAFTMGGYDELMLSNNGHRLRGVYLQDQNQQWVEWKIDTTLKQIDKFFFNGELDQCLSICDKAFQEDTSRFWIGDYIKSIQYQNSYEYDDVNWSEYPGKYGNRLIRFDKLNQLVYSRIGREEKVLYPIAKDVFKIEHSPDFRLNAVRKEGNIVGLIGHFYNVEKNEWEVRESDFSPRSEN